MSDETPFPGTQQGEGPAGEHLDGADRSAGASRDVTGGGARPKAAATIQATPVPAAADEAAADEVSADEVATSAGATRGTDERTAMTLADIVGVMNGLYPPALAEPWDRVGLVAGDPAAPVRKVALAVDPVRAVIDEALAWGADLLITHHPLLLRPVNSVAADTFKGALVHRLIRGGCALLTAHTNADAAPDGVAEALARAIGVTKDLRPLRRAEVARAVDEDGGLGSPGQAGSSGEAGSSGQAGSADKERGGTEVGIGRVGRLLRPMPLREFVELVGSSIPATAHGVRVAGRLDEPVELIAVVGGAGDSLFDDVRASGADVYVTADLRHHPASEARERAEFDGDGRPFLLDVSHAASEWPWLNVVARQLRDAARERRARLETRISTLPTDPWTARFGG